MTTRTKDEFAGSAILPGHSVRVSETVASVPIPRLDHGAEPRIELIREGDVIKAIDITCGCGQRIRLHCAYQ